MKRTTRIAIQATLLVILITFAVDVTSLPSSTPEVDWAWGDVFVAVGNGSYQVWHSANPADPANNPYTLVQTINDGLGGTTTGCTCDSGGRFFGTNFTNTTVNRYSINNAYGLVQAIATGTGSPASSHPESIVFGNSEFFFVGHADHPSGFGNGTIEKWTLNTSTGAFQLLNTYAVPIENRGADWIDLTADGHTIFYTSEGRLVKRFDVFNNAPLPDFANLGTAGGSQVTLFALRLLPPGDGSGGLLVADKKNIKLVTVTSGTVNIVRTYDVGGQDDWEFLNLDPNGTSCWAGDATTHNFYRFNITSGQKEVGPINTNASLSGICVYGAFSAAQQNFGPPPATQTFPLTPGDNTLSFTSPLTGAIFTATLANLQTNTSVTLRDYLVHPSVAQSDPMVFSFNPGSSVTTVAGNMPCDTTLTALANPPLPPSCEVFQIDANPNPGFTTNVKIDRPANVSENTPNLRLLRNLDEDITTSVVNYPTSGTRTKCVFTVNQQTSNKAFQICGDGFSSLATSFSKNKTSTITFKFKVSQTGTCPNGQSPTNLKPLLMIVQTTFPSTGVTQAPVSIPVIIAGNSGGPPIFNLSGNTWQLQAKTKNMEGGGATYIATMIDLTSTIPSISASFTLN
jgi:hypothetical protein